MQEILSFAFVLLEKRLDCDTKLIAIMRRQFCIILTSLEEHIFSVSSRQYNAGLPSFKNSQLVYMIDSL